jgi:hypothetical protein
VSWKDCLQQAHLKQINRINVTGLINCLDSSCALSVSGVSQFKIMGSGEGAFNRTGGFDAPLFKFTSVNSIVVSGIKVFEIANKPIQLQPGQEEVNAVCLNLPNQKCASTLEIYESYKVQVSQSYFENGKVFNAIFWKIEDLQVQQSRFDHAFLFGIWGEGNKKISITNSIFHKNRSNAFLMGFTETENAIIRYNIFDNNHHATAFHVCGPNRNEPCPGGQIDLVKKVQSTIIEKNRFLNSKLSGEFPEDVNPNLLITGIEFEPYESSIQNTHINSNYYQDLSSGIFYVNMPHPQNPDTFRSDIKVVGNNYCKAPRALFNFSDEFRWADHILYSNNFELCSADLGSIPPAPKIPQNQLPNSQNPPPNSQNPPPNSQNPPPNSQNPPPKNVTYFWQTTEWSSCSANPSYVYSPWSECLNGFQTRTAQCIGQEGEQKRTIWCQSSDGQTVADLFCNSSTRPTQNRICQVQCLGAPQLRQSCTVTQPPPAQAMSGMISGSDCTIQAGQTMCTSKIEWSTTGAPEACVFANGVLFACQGEQSSKLAPWITMNGVTFELRINRSPSSTLLKKIVVIGM